MPNPLQAGLLSRRQALAALAAVGLAGCGTARHPTAVGGALTMPCPTPTLGTLTNLSGSFAGIQASALVDGYSTKDPTRYNWQWTEILTNKADHGGGCARYQTRSKMAGEVWLYPSLIGGRVNTAQGDYDYCPPPPTPITLAASGNVAVVSADGLSMWSGPVKALPIGDRCRDGKVLSAVSGTVTFTRLVEPYTFDLAGYDGTNSQVLTATGETGQGIVEGTLDQVDFGGGQVVSGSFVAPFCSRVGCAAWPSSWGCVT